MEKLDKRMFLSYDIVFHCMSGMWICQNLRQDARDDCLDVGRAEHAPMLVSMQIHKI